MDLINKTLEKEPLYIACLEVSKDGERIYDTCCNKYLLSVLQNLTSHFKAKKHYTNVNSEVEAKKCIASIPEQIR